MKILILLKTWVGGPATYVKEVKRELENLGHEVTVITREECLGINSLAKSIFAIRKTAKADDYDIIYTKDWSLAFPLLFPYPILKDKHYCGFGGLQPGKAKHLQKLTYAMMPNRIICYGDPVKNEYPNAHQIFNGVNTERFKPMPEIERIPNSVGFVNCPEDQWNFGIVKEAVEKTGKKFMNIWGVPNEDMPKFYNQIETFISYPPEYTGFNLCWLEAMACGVPKIIGTNSGIGCRLPISKIQDFINIEDSINNVTEKDYAKMVGDFTWKAHTKKLIDLWQQKRNKNK